MFAPTLPRHRRPETVRVLLPDGGTAEIRPLRPGERAPLLEVFAGLSPESRASRYLVAMPRLGEPYLRSLTTTDGATSLAWLATVGDRAAGIGRYARMTEDPCAVDVALEVVDEHQRRGLGGVLLDAVSTLAAANGVRRLHATVHPHNAASRRLLTQVGIPLAFEEGLLEGSAPVRLLDPPRVDRHAVVDLARRTAPTATDALWTAPCA
jgi:RimJ/RimL family protein N-acetyltransferase